MQLTRTTESGRCSIPLFRIPSHLPQALPLLPKLSNRHRLAITRLLRVSNLFPYQKELPRCPSRSPVHLLSPTSPSGRIGLVVPNASIGDPGPSSSLHRHRASISSDASSSKGSPASPQLNLPSNSSSSTTTKETKPAKVPYVPPPPPPPLSNPVDLLERSRTGLSQLIGYGNVDARPSRQKDGGLLLKKGACSACRMAKAKCTQRQPACERCVSMNIDCIYAVFAKRGRKRTMTP